MQFGREPLPKTPEMMTADGEPGWICSDHAEHFQLASALPIASTRAQASGVNQEGATASTTFNPR